MTTDEPLDLTIQKMNRVMDEIEKLLTQTTGAREVAGGQRWAFRLLIGYTVAFLIP